MKKLIIMLLFFTISINLSGVFASPDSQKIQKLMELMNIYSTKEKLSEVNNKLSHAFCDDNILPEEQNRIIEDVENTFSENKDNSYFRTYGLEMCNQYIENDEFSKNYVQKPENATSTDPHIRFLYEIHKLKNILDK